MGPFEYLLLFVSVIFGLAISDLGMSLHRLLGAGPRVRWDALAPLAALVAFLKIASQWWSWFSDVSIARGFTWEMFLGLLAGAMMLFLMAAAALPDEAPADATIDLAQHWESVRRRYWILFLGHWLVANAVSIWAQVSIAHARWRFDWPYLLGLVILSLILIRNRWWQGLCLAGLVVIYVGQFFGHARGG